MISAFHVQQTLPLPNMITVPRPQSRGLLGPHDPCRCGRGDDEGRRAILTSGASQKLRSIDSGRPTLPFDRRGNNDERKTLASKYCGPQCVCWTPFLSTDSYTYCADLRGSMQPMGARNAAASLAYISKHKGWPRTKGLFRSTKTGTSVVC